MKNTMKLKLLAAAAMMVAGSVHAGDAFLNGLPVVEDGSVATPYDFGTLSATPELLFVSLGLSSSTPFEEHANFYVPTSSNGSGVANTYAVTFFGVNLVDITGLTVNVWDGVHPNGTTNFATFSGNNITTSFGTLAAGQYHLDITGTIGPDAYGGQYSVALSATPVPEPETYAMFLAGLGLMGFMARRRSKAA